MGEEYPWDEDAKVAHLNGRVSEPEEIAALAAYLLSDEAASVTGSHHVIDGGWCLK
jgi:NAD(P)-dependent dehydrogenase (short-subunit alcohol dehydrogenase family)